VKSLRIEGIRFKIVLISFVVALCIVFPAKYLGHRKLVVEPIYEAFSRIKGVKKVELTETDGKMKLVINLDDVEQLELVMQQILDQVEHFQRPMQLVITDQANQKLEHVYHQMHFAIEQGITLGTFVEMAQNIESIAQANQILSRVAVDRDYVYVQLQDGEHYLYQVISRNSEMLIGRLKG